MDLLILVPTPRYCSLFSFSSVISFYYLLRLFTLLTHRVSGELRHIQKLRFWPLEAVLNDKYLLPKEEADLIASFLNPMLRLHPEKRAKAGELMHHNWLESVVVQGEIDVIRRAELEDARRKAKAVEAAGGERSSSAEDAARKVGDETVDAMKPVDEDTSATEGESDSAPAAGVPHASTHAVPKLTTPVPSSAGAKENVRTGKEGAGHGHSLGHHKPPPNGKGGTSR